MVVENKTPDRHVVFTLTNSWEEEVIVTVIVTVCNLHVFVPKLKRTTVFALLKVLNEVVELCHFGDKAMQF